MNKDKQQVCKSSKVAYFMIFIRLVKLQQGLPLCNELKLERRFFGDSASFESLRRLLSTGRGSGYPEASLTH